MSHSRLKSYSTSIELPLTPRENGTLLAFTLYLACDPSLLRPRFHLPMSPLDW